MTYEQSNGITIDDAFAEYHHNNPQVYRAFVAQAMRAIDLGRKKISFKLIMNYLRWEVYLRTEENHDSYRINDAYGSRYAELFVKEHPEHADKVEMREKRSRRQMRLRGI